MITADNLNDIMSFDHVVRVHLDGSVTEESSTWAPECYIEDPDNHDIHDPYVTAPWKIMSGYSGQFGYSGPIMHESEFIGGKMADDILNAPGLYVSVIVADMSDDDDDRDAGWAVAYRSGTV